MKKLVCLLFCGIFVLSIMFASRAFAASADDKISAEVTTRLKAWKGPDTNQRVRPEGGGEWRGSAGSLEPGCALCGVQVVSRLGFVTLTGKVPSLKAKQAAAEIVREMPGVKGVNNRLAVGN